jgi:hypothetical protein
MASGTVTVDKTDSPVFAPAGYLTHLGKYMETKIKSTGMSAGTSALKFCAVAMQTFLARRTDAGKLSFHPLTDRFFE